MKINTFESKDYYVEYISLGTEKPRKATFIFFPGNPGYCGFYQEFLSMLREIFIQKGWKEDDFQLLSISLAGFWVCKPPKIGTSLYYKDYNLDNQAEYFRNVIRNLYMDINKDCSFYFAGHSIGAYILSDVVHSLTEIEKSRIKKCFLICPALMELEKSPNGQGYWMQNLVHNKLYLSSMIEYAFRYWVALTPSWMKEYIFKKFHGSTESLDPHIQNIHSHRLLKAMLYLSKHEFDHLKELKLEIYESLQHRYAFIFSDNDNWVPNTYREHIESNVNLYQNDMNTYSIKHAFCIYKQDNQTVAEHVSQFITFQ